MLVMIRASRSRYLVHNPAVARAFLSFSTASVGVETEKLKMEAKGMVEERLLDILSCLDVSFLSQSHSSDDGIFSAVYQGASPASL